MDGPAGRKMFYESFEPAFIWHRRTPVQAISVSPIQRVQMSIKSKFSAAALATVVAISAMTATSANAVSRHSPKHGLKFLDSQASAASEYCVGAAPRSGCGTHDISPDYMKRLDPRYNTSMLNAG